MVTAESPVLVVATAGGPTQALEMSEALPAMSNDHLSENSSSLMRRSRVKRKNSRTGEDSSSDVLSTSGDISSGQLFVKIPSTETRPGSSPKSLSAWENGVPPRPPRSPRRLQTDPLFDTDNVNSNHQRIPRQRTRSIDPSVSRPVIDDTRGRETRSETGQHRKGQRSRGVSLPRHTFRNGSLSDSSEQPSPLTPNAFNDTPPIPVFASNRRFCHQPQDSGVTHQSTTSSSIYPRSTSTEGSYPYPPSLPAQDLDDRHIVTVDPADNPHLDALHEMDADEVSYRLRLLMQNNYYLPPAHAKPFSEIPSPDTQKKSPAKSPSPTFFDLFKVVKKKTIASTDNRSNTPPAPILRTTSDSSTLSGLLRPQQPSAPTQRVRSSFPESQIRQESKGRVVVVRERVEDITTVAKQVEQELKAREAERQGNATDMSHSDQIQAQFVDPTDSVDLPLVRSGEFFGPQAALLRGMGIDTSLGAALLADQLPPSSSGGWSAESEDVVWRKALLHAAVDHSLNNSSTETPVRSVTSSNQLRVSALPSPTAPSTSPSMPPQSVASPTANLQTLPSRPAEPSELQRKTIIGQRILNCILDEPDGALNASPNNLERFDKAEHATGMNADGMKNSHGLLVATDPVRASSPTVPTMPLQPPPRRLNMVSSGSSSDHAPDDGDKGDDSNLVVDTSAPHAEQDTTLRLSDVYESHVGLAGAFGKLTPPGSQHTSVTAPAGKPVRMESSKQVESSSTTSGSHYSDEEGELSTFHTPQEQTLVSTTVGSRVSLGSLSVARESFESSYPSPTTSAFRDAYERSNHADSFVDQADGNTLGDNSRIASRTSNRSDALYPVVTPPPRVSSMLAFNHMNSRRTHRVDNGSREAPHDRAMASNSAELEEPGTPTALHVPRLTVQDLLRSSGQSSPYPASPISFFDAVEMQSHEEDESSSSESDDNEGEEEGQDDVSIMSSSVSGRLSDSVAADPPRIGSTQSLEHDPRHVSGSLMQHRNASSPQLGTRTSTNERGTGLEYNTIDRWRAISNVPRSPVRPAFWNKKHGKQHELFSNPPRASESTADWVKHEEAKGALIGARRPQTASSRVDSSTTSEQQDREDSSVSRLDGMLIEHMEREREVLKRITTTVSKSSS